MALLLRQVVICLFLLCSDIHLCKSEGTETEESLKTRYIVPRVQIEASEQEGISAQNEYPGTVSSKLQSDVHEGVSFQNEYPHAVSSKHPSDVQGLMLFYVINNTRPNNQPNIQNEYPHTVSSKVPSDVHEGVSAQNEYSDTVSSKHQSDLQDGVSALNEYPDTVSSKLQSDVQVGFSAQNVYPDTVSSKVTSDVHEGVSAQNEYPDTVSSKLQSDVQEGFSAQNEYPDTVSSKLQSDVPEGVSAQNVYPDTVSSKITSDVHASRTEAKSYAEKLIMRGLKVCQTPTESKTSSTFCKWKPDRVVCDQTCIYGYTLPQGQRVKTQCLYEADVWDPVEPSVECKPYVDCTLTLGTGAKKHCLTHFMDHGPVCNLSCAAYEDKKPVPVTTYECNDKGEWSPKLPFCVNAGSDLELVDKPVYKTEDKNENKDKDGNEIKDKDGNEIKDKDGTEIKVKDGNEIKDKDGNEIKDKDGNEIKDKDGNEIIETNGYETMYEVENEDNRQMNYDSEE